MPAISRTRPWIVLAVLLAAVAGCRDDAARKPTAQAASSRFEPTPIALTDLDGKPFDLWSGDGERITVVVFTRTDCPLSNRFAPEIRRLHGAYHARGVDFYLIYVDSRETPAAIRQHLQEYEYPCQGLRDLEHTLVAHCEATATPEAVVFDKHRMIAYQGRINDLYADFGKMRSEPTTHDLEDALAATVAGQPVATPRTKAIGCLIADLKP